MTTTADRIRQIRDLYPEVRAFGNALSEMDFLASQEPDAIDSSFQKEIDAVEAHFGRVLGAYGEYIGHFPFRKSAVLRGALLAVLDAVK